MRVKKSGFTLIELMAVIVIVCVMLLIGSSIVFQCFKINKKTDNNTIMENKYRTIISNIEKDIKSSELVEVYNKGQKIKISNIGDGYELVHFKQKQSQNTSYMYVLTSKSDSDLKELHLLKVNDKNFNNNTISKVEEDTFIEDSISDINITKSNDLDKLIDVNVNLRRMNDTREYSSSISKSNFVFKDEISNPNVDGDFLDRTSNYTLNVLSNETSENSSAFNVSPKGKYLTSIYEKHMWINGQEKLYEVKLKNDLGNDIHLTNATIYVQQQDKNFVDILSYKYPNEFRNKKPIKGPNLNFDSGKYTISYVNPFVVIRNNSIYNPYKLTTEDGKTVGISTNVGQNKLVILINGDLVINSTEQVDSAYIYCTGKIVIDNRASISITNSKLVANKGIFINDVSSLNIVGDDYGKNTFTKDEINNVLKKYNKK